MPKKLKKIKVVTKVMVEQPSDERVLMDLLDIVDSIGHDDIPFTLDWSDKNENVLYKKFLVETYGEEIKKYDEFILDCC